MTVFQPTARKKTPVTTLWEARQWPSRLASRDGSDKVHEATPAGIEAEGVVSASAGSAIESAALQRLESSGYPALASVRCVLQGRVLVLRGTVPSFYLKQVAQERVRSIVGVESVANGVTVYVSF